MSFPMHIRIRIQSIDIFIFGHLISKWTIPLLCEWIGSIHFAKWTSWQVVFADGRNGHPSKFKRTDNSFVIILVIEWMSFKRIHPIKLKWTCWDIHLCQRHLRCPPPTMRCDSNLLEKRISALWRYKFRQRKQKWKKNKRENLHLTLAMLPWRRCKK